MEVRTYRAREMKEALQMIKSELGADAIILSSRTIDNDGLWKTRMIEVQATSDQSVIEENRPKATKPMAYGPVPGILPVFNSKNGTEEASARPEPTVKPRRFNYRTPTAQYTVRRQEKTPAPQIRLEPGESEIARIMENILRDSGVSQENAEFLASSIAVDMPPNFPANEKNLRQKLIGELSRQLSCGGDIMSGNRRKIIAMVGPTGSGKTTTAAKIAATEALIRGKKVAMISADGYRIAASEQLKQYGNLIGIAVEVVQTRAEMSNAIRRLSGADLIIIDTAGRNYRDSSSIARLGRLLSAAGSVEVHLVLPATTRDNELMAVCEAHMPLTPARMIFTKVDEALSCGVIYNVQQFSNLPLSVLGTGQSVPEDMETADPRNLAELIINGGN